MAVSNAGVENGAAAVAGAAALPAEAAVTALFAAGFVGEDMTVSS
jgi:hypothetical protein